MKKLLLFTIFLVSLNSINAQLMIQDSYGDYYDIDEIIKGDKDQPVIFMTWARSWCWPCVKALDEFNKDYSKLHQKYDLKLIALNLDSEYTPEEIGDFAYDRDWDFDVFIDNEQKFLEMTEMTSAPITFLILNGELITSYNGFIDGVAEPESTADYFIEILNDLYSNIIYYDEDWDNTTKENATYMRYRDKIGDVYEVTDRWITGEIQMRGTYTDFHCTDEIGEFKWYEKDGSLSDTITY
jgi:peroxiredoxin